MVNEQNAPVLYNTKDLMQIFHCGRDKAYAMMSMHGFPSFRLDGTYLVEKGELERWIGRCKGAVISTDGRRKRA